MSNRVRTATKSFLMQMPASCKRKPDRTAADQTRATVFKQLAIRTGRSRCVIADRLERQFAREAVLSAAGRSAAFAHLHKATQSATRASIMRDDEALGRAHAICCGRDIAGDSRRINAGWLAGMAAAR